ncbi:putative membrane protein, partial [Escherichia coli 8.0586]|jgi:hypothetical protein
MAIQ